MTTIDPEDATALTMRVFSILASAKGDYCATPNGPLPGPDRPHELGEFIGEGFFHTADIVARLAAGMGRSEQDDLMHGIVMEWFQGARNETGNGAMAALAFLARLLHAAVHGVMIAHRDRDLADAHHLAEQLQECLVLCAGISGVAGEAMRFLAEQSDPGTA